MHKWEQLPFDEITIYPIIDRPDWDDLDHWHNSGLWDILRSEDGILQRVLNEDYASVLREVQRHLSISNASQAFKRHQDFNSDTTS